MIRTSNNNKNPGIILSITHHSVGHYACKLQIALQMYMITTIIVRRKPPAGLEVFYGGAYLV